MSVTAGCLYSTDLIAHFLIFPFQEFSPADHHIHLFGTFINYKYGPDAKLSLEVLCEGDPLLFNPYGVIPVNPAKFPHVKNDLAEQFAQWLISERGQSVIANYRLLGKQLFYPDAKPN